MPIEDGVDWDAAWAKFRETNDLVIKRDRGFLKGAAQNDDAAPRVQEAFSRRQEVRGGVDVPRGRGPIGLPGDEGDGQSGGPPSEFNLINQLTSEGVYKAYAGLIAGLAVLYLYVGFTGGITNGADRMMFLPPPMEMNEQLEPLNYVPAEVPLEQLIVRSPLNHGGVSDCRA